MFKAGRSFKSLVTNPFRTEGKIYKIYRDSNSLCHYISNNGTIKQVSNLQTIELIRPESEAEYLDFFQMNFRNGV